MVYWRTSVTLFKGQWCLQVRFMMMFGVNKSARVYAAIHGAMWGLLPAVQLQARPLMSALQHIAATQLYCLA